MFLDILGVAFIFFLALIGLEFFIATDQSSHWRLLRTIVSLLLFLIFNPVAEVTYTHRFSGMHALSHAANFIKDNWIEWFIPLAILMAPAIYLYADSIALILANAEILLPATAIVRVWSIFGLITGYALSLIGILIAIWFMLFRGFLFAALDSSSRRQRAFKWRQG